MTDLESPGGGRGRPSEMKSRAVAMGRGLPLGQQAGQHSMANHDNSTSAEE